MSGTGKKVAGAINYLKGKLQRAVGGLTGNKTMRAKGYGNQAKGGATYGIGKAQDRADQLRER